MNQPDNAHSVQVDLDPFDLALLRALQADGRLTNQQLAERVHLSPSQCSRRRARLEATGFIRGIHAELEPARLGFGVLVFMNVSLSRQSANMGTRFRRDVMRLPEVLEAYMVAGEADFLLKARVADLGNLAGFINRLTADETVAQVRTTIALEEVKTGGGLPI